MTDAAPIGHNRPPEEFASLREIADRIVDNANRWIRERPRIEDESQAEAAADFQHQIRRWSERFDKLFAEEKAPYEKALKDIRQEFEELRGPVDLSLKAINTRLNDWLDREKARIERERREKAEAARRAREAAARKEAEARRAREEEERRRREADTGKPAQTSLDVAPETEQIDPIRSQWEADQAKKKARKASYEAAAEARKKARVKGTFGQRRVHQRKTYTAEIIRIDDALQHYRANREVHELIRKLAEAEARRKGGDPMIPGIKVHVGSRAV